MNRPDQRAELHCLLAHVRDHVAAAQAMEAVLPKVYEDRSTTLLQFEIGAGARTIDLALKKKP